MHVEVGVRLTAHFHTTSFLSLNLKPLASSSILFQQQGGGLSYFCIFIGVYNYYSSFCWFFHQRPQHAPCCLWSGSKRGSCSGLATPRGRHLPGNWRCSESCRHGSDAPFCPPSVAIAHRRVDAAGTGRMWCSDVQVMETQPWHMF